MLSAEDFEGCFLQSYFHSQLILTEFSGVVWPRSVSLCTRLPRLIDLG